MSKAEVVVRDGLTIEDLDEQDKEYESLVEEEGGRCLLMAEIRWSDPGTHYWVASDENESVPLGSHEDLAQVARDWLECFE